MGTNINPLDQSGGGGSSDGTTENILVTANRPPPPMFIADDVFTGTYGDSGNFAAGASHVGGWSFTTLMKQPWSQTSLVKTVAAQVNKNAEVSIGNQDALGTIQGDENWVKAQIGTIHANTDISTGYEQLESAVGNCTETAAAGAALGFGFGILQSKVPSAPAYTASAIQAVAAGVSSMVGCIINLNNNLTPNENAALQDMEQSSERTLQYEASHVGGIGHEFVPSLGKVGAIIASERAIYATSIPAGGVHPSLATGAGADAIMPAVLSGHHAF